MSDMVKRPGDKAPEPPGGRAAKRLQMFEQARKPDSPPSPADKKPTKGGTRPAKAEGADEKQTGQKD